MLPNQIAPRHHQYYYGAVPNAQADPPGDRLMQSSYSEIVGLCLLLALTNQVLNLHKCGLHTV